MTARSLVLGLAAAAALGQAQPALAAEGPSREDYRLYKECQEAFDDARLRAMTEDERIAAVAKVNFKMKAADLKAALDRVAAAGGPEGLATEGQQAVRAALATTDVSGRVGDVRLDTTTLHVVTYVTWTVEDPKKLAQEAVLVSLKTARAAPVATTLFLEARDRTGGVLWRAKLGADHTKNIQEDRIADWATTRYLRLFEVVTPLQASDTGVAGTTTATPTSIQ